MYRTGKACDEEGRYRSTDCGYEIEVLESEAFPMCPLHDRAVTWTLVKKTASPNKKSSRKRRRAKST